jgi:hypothetical protein
MCGVIIKGVKLGLYVGIIQDALPAYCLFSVWPFCKKDVALVQQRKPLYSQIDPVRAPF